MATTTKINQEQINQEQLAHIGELVKKEFAAFRRYLGNDIQLEHLLNVRIEEYWNNILQRLKEEEKQNGRTTSTGDGTLPITADAGK